MTSSTLITQPYNTTLATLDDNQLSYVNLRRTVEALIGTGERNMDGPQGRAGRRTIGEVAWHEINLEIEDAGKKK